MWIEFSEVWICIEILNMHYKLIIYTIVVTEKSVPAEKAMFLAAYLVRRQKNFNKIVNFNAMRKVFWSSIRIVLYQQITTVAKKAISERLIYYQFTMQHNKR